MREMYDCEVRTWGNDSTGKRIRTWVTMSVEKAGQVPSYQRGAQNATVQSDFIRRDPAMFLVLTRNTSSGF
jgi:hypothetical protein